MLDFFKNLSERDIIVLGAGGGGVLLLLIIALILFIKVIRICCCQKEVKSNMIAPPPSQVLRIPRKDKPTFFKDNQGQMDMDNVNYHHYSTLQPPRSNPRSSIDRSSAMPSYATLPAKRTSTQFAGLSASELMKERRPIQGSQPQLSVYLEGEQRPTITLPPAQPQSGNTLAEASF